MAYPVPGTPDFQQQVWQYSQENPNAWNSQTTYPGSGIPIIQGNPNQTSTQPRIGLEPNNINLGPTPTEQGAQNNVTSAQNQMKGDIENKYSNYFGQLDNMLMQDLPTQKGAQEGMVNTQYQQGVSDLNTQQSQALGDINLSSQQAETAHAKNLKGLSEDVRNSMRAGNIYLGTRGASDSSAANQYGYALGVEANKQRSNLMSNYQNVKSEIDNRIFKVKSTVQNEMTRLQNDMQTKIFQIAQSFADAQMQIKQAKANGELSKGTDLATLSQNLYNQAVTQLNAIQTNVANQKNTLLQWATTRSTNLAELQKNIQGALSNMPQVAQAQGFNIAPTATPTQRTYFPGAATDNTKKTSLFGGSGVSGGGMTGGW